MLDFQPATASQRTVHPVWRVEVDRVTPAEWYEMLGLFDDANIYQTWSYGTVRWGRQNLSHLVLKRNDEVLAMAQLRIIRPPHLNCGMAYLRWGPLCYRRRAQLNSEAARLVARSLEEEYVAKRGLMLWVLPNAFMGSARATLLQSAFAKLSSQPRTSANSYRTFILDLTPSLEELRSNLDKKWRNQLTCAEKNRLRIVVGYGKDEYRIFCSMYQQMRDRKAFRTTVDVEEFERIHENLPEAHRLRILICEQEGAPVAGLVASAIGDSAIYLLGATSDKGLKAKGSYLLQWSLIQWLKENGFKTYDLGGIDPKGNPGVYHFKKGLSGTDVFQLPPQVACNSFLSSAVVKSGLAIHNVVLRMRTMRFPVAGN